jgi:hypothetical protein
VRWGTKCQQLQTRCLKWSMFCTSPCQSKRVPPPSLLARRTTSGAGMAPIQPQLIPTASSTDRTPSGPSGQGITCSYPGSCKWTSENSSLRRWVNKGQSGRRAPVRLRPPVADDTPLEGTSMRSARTGGSHVRVSRTHRRSLTVRCNGSRSRCAPDCSGVISAGAPPRKAS